MSNKKSPKDIAFEKERVKFRGLIRELEREIKNEKIEKLQLKEQLTEKEIEIEGLKLWIERLLEYTELSKEDIIKINEIYIIKIRRNFQVMKKKLTTVEFRGTPEQEAKLVEIIAGYKDVPGSMMPIMQEAQSIYGYLPIEGATSASCNTGALHMADDGNTYYCKVTNQFGEAITPIYIVHVMEAVVVPQTGDNAQLGLWYALMAISVLALGVAFAARKRSKG